MAENKDQTRFHELIESVTGFRVLPLTPEIRADIIPFVEQAIRDYNAGPVFAGRPNEFGNHMEGVLKNTTPRFDKPRKANGRKQSTGYPDLTIISHAVTVYPEIKTYDKDNVYNPMRAFYLSSFDKITADAVHVVIGFEHKDKILTGQYHIVDMAKKVLTVKVEYACSNRDLYTVTDEA